MTQETKPQVRDETLRTTALRETAQLLQGWPRLANVLVSDSELALECSQLVAPDLSMTCSASQTQLAFALGNSVAPGATAQCQVVPRNLEAIVALPRSPEPTSHAHRPIEQRRREEWPHLVRPL
ncbi:hypothetical protein E4U17_006208 [Claviceps sp. LM77 group G4]|nr:hypothetical protein E4U17_006208 [Claviceps sp. LM77 group G4]